MPSEMDKTSESFFLPFLKSMTQQLAATETVIKRQQASHAGCRMAYDG